MKQKKNAEKNKKELILEDEELKKKREDIKAMKIDSDIQEYEDKRERKRRQEIITPDKVSV